MEFMIIALPFVKVIAAFCLMLVGIRNKLGLALSILAGGLFMGLIFGLSTTELLKASSLALVQEKFLFLVTIVGAILILSDALEKSGQSVRLMDALSGYLVRPRLRLIFFPALIGLLPMPGGAIFSAPMVKAVSADMHLNKEDKVVINYWFRHVWEMAWPLYPGIILTVALAEVPVTAYIAKSWPGVVAMFAIGWFFFLRPGVLHTAALPSAADLPQWNRSRRKVVTEGLPLIIAIVAAIFVFKDVMQAAGIVEAMAQSAGGGVALFAAAVFLPFLVGMVAGINVAFVGATFPLLIGLLNSLGMEDRIVP